MNTNWWQTKFLTTQKNGKKMGTSLTYEQTSTEASQTTLHWIMEGWTNPPGSGTPQGCLLPTTLIWHRVIRAKGHHSDIRHTRSLKRENRTVPMFRYCCLSRKSKIFFKKLTVSERVSTCNLHVCTCTVYMSGTCKGQKRPLHPLNCS